ncbi:MAG: hypothetical protein ACR2GU_03730 [Rubrobacteraceae bacterium]
MLVLLILIIVGALFALISGLVAFQAWLRFRRTRLVVQDQLSNDVERLVLRTREVEKKIRALEARAGVLPVHVHELQQNLTTLKVLTGALTTSLNRSRKALSRGLVRNPPQSVSRTSSADTSRKP